MNYTCPVCGFPEMPFPPQDNNICSCCGTEFGYHDCSLSHSQLRQMWIGRGAPWFSTALTAPPDWNAAKQLKEFLSNPSQLQPR